MKKSVLSVSVVLAVSICSAQWLERKVVLGDTFGCIGNLDGTFANSDVRRLPAGVYFVRQAAGSRTTKVVIQR